MPEIKRIDLKDIIKLTQDFIDGKVDEKAMAEFGNNMTIRSYIPLQEKVGLLMLLLLRYSYSGYNSKEVFVGELYRNMFFYILLGGYAFVDCSNSTLVTNENYDLLYPVFAPFLLTYCKDDYEQIKEMLKDGINFYNIEKLINGFDEMDVEALMKTSKSNQELIDKIENNQKMVKDLKDILIATNPDARNTLEAFTKKDIKK